MKKILVVDNHLLMLKYMKILLEKKGHEVVTAQDGLSALTVLETYMPDVIFIDLIMPNINGERLCRIIRNKPEFNNVHVVILSAVAAEEKIDFAELGANACIAKGPFNKMGKNIFAVLEQLDQESSNIRPEKIWGLEDVHEREITLELLYTKRHFEVILSHMSEGIFEVASGNKIVYANPSAISLTGISQEKLLASDFIELFHESYHEGIKDILDMSGDIPHEISDSFPVTQSGKQVSLYVIPVNDNEHQSKLAIMTDVSEKKRIEQQLLHGQKMEAIATLAGGIAHQFNNALSVISGNVEFLKMTPGEEENTERYIKPVQTATHRMVNLTNQLLAYARGGKYNPKSVSLSDFVGDTLPLIQHTINPDIMIETDLPRDVLNVEVDLTQIQMVISAILANSNEAIEGPGHIRIIARNREIKEEFVKQHPDLKPGSYVCLTVEDDGKGMDDQTKNRIFDPFYTTKFQGRGLGMAAVYGIIRNHNGNILVDSEFGKGTSVNIYLPAVESMEKEIEETRVEETVKGAGTILVIEDEEMVLDVNIALLKKLGYHALAAKTAKEAIHIAKTFEGDIDVTLLDIVLPDMEGKNLYPLLMEARPNMKVIICSGFAIDGPAQAILNEGAQDFIQKPYSVSTLSLKLKKLINGVDS